MGTAPSKEGIYNFTVCVRSDSYLGVDLLEDIKLDVQKAWEAPKEHKQWDFSDEDEDDENKKDERKRVNMQRTRILKMTPTKSIRITCDLSGRTEQLQVHFKWAA